MNRLLAALSVVCLASLSVEADAHRFASGLIHVRNLSGDKYQLAVTPSELKVRVGGCERPSPTILRCQGGALSALRISVTEWPSILEDAIVRVDTSERRATQVLTRDASVFGALDAPANESQTFGALLRLGVTHVLSGPDHLLFLLSLLFIAGGARRLLWMVTAFTVAHSVTLAAAALEVFRPPSAPIEALIALSVAFSARDALLQEKRRAIAFAFGFGLLHGFGFASALSELGLPKDGTVGFLLSFNLGVELGQLMFITGAMALLRTLSTRRINPAAIRVSVAYATGITAIWWTLERVVAFVPAGVSS